MFRGYLNFLFILALEFLLHLNNAQCSFEECKSRLGSADLELREMERVALTGGPESILHYWAALRRTERVPEIFAALAGTAHGRPTSEVSKLALEVYKASIITADRIFLPNELPHRLRDRALRNGFTIDEFLEQTPRFTQMIPLIKPGEEIEFLMGAGEEERVQFDIPSRLRIQHRVKLTEPVSIGANLVTIGFWRMVVGSLPPRYKTHNVCPNDNEPVSASYIMITKKFLPKLNKMMKGSGFQYRLPFETELELAMRMDKDGKPTMLIFPWGNEWSENHSYANQQNDFIQAPQVDTKMPTGLLFADLSGRLRQWTDEAYEEDYGGVPALSINPRGPQGVRLDRVVRGGHLRDNPANCSSAFRDWASTDLDWFYVGFRLAEIPEK